MSPRMLAAALAGASVGAGLWLLLLALRRAPAAGRRTARPGRGAARLAAGVVAGLVVWRATGWPAAGAGIGLLAAGADRLLGGGRRQALALARLEALTAWTEALRDMTATGLGLPEALLAASAAAGPAVAEPMQALAGRLAARTPLAVALRALADDLADDAADLTVAALLLAATAQGRALAAVLGDIAASARAELAVRRGVQAERRGTRRAVQFVVATTVGTALGLALADPDYVAPYASLPGQLVLSAVVALFGAGFWWLARLAAPPPPARLLAAGVGS